MNILVIPWLLPRIQVKQFHSLVSIKAYTTLFCIQFFQALFQWLYSCAQMKAQSSELYTFVLQFVPDLIVIYLHGIYENKTQVCVSVSVCVCVCVSVCVCVCVCVCERERERERESESE